MLHCITKSCARTCEPISADTTSEDMDAFATAVSELLDTKVSTTRQKTIVLHDLMHFVLLTELCSS